MLANGISAQVLMLKRVLHQVRQMLDESIDFKMEDIKWRTLRAEQYRGLRNLKIPGLTKYFFS